MQKRAKCLGQVKSKMRTVAASQSQLICLQQRHLHAITEMEGSPMCRMLSAATQVLARRSNRALISSCRMMILDLTMSLRSRLASLKKLTWRPRIRLAWSLGLDLILNLNSWEDLDKVALPMDKLELAIYTWWRNHWNSIQMLITESLFIKKDRKWKSNNHKLRINILKHQPKFTIASLTCRFEHKRTQLLIYNVHQQFKKFQTPKWKRQIVTNHQSCTILFVIMIKITLGDSSMFQAVLHRVVVSKVEPWHHTTLMEVQPATVAKELAAT